MVYEQSCALRALALNNATWTDVAGPSIPIDCNLVIIFNNSGVDIFLRTDPGNANSQVTINPGQQFEIGGAPRPPSFGPSRFISGDSTRAACSLMASSGSPNVLIECIQ